MSSLDSLFCLEFREKGPCFFFYCFCAFSGSMWWSSYINFDRLRGLLLSCLTSLGNLFFHHECYPLFFSVHLQKRKKTWFEILPTHRFTISVRDKWQGGERHGILRSFKNVFCPRHPPCCQEFVSSPLKTNRCKNWLWHKCRPPLYSWSILHSKYRFQSRISAPSFGAWLDEIFG